MWIALVLLVTALAEEPLPPCQEPAVGLLRYDIEGLKVYKALDNPASFGFWLACEDEDYGVPSAVHESVHLLSGRVEDDRYAVYLLGGKQVVVPMGPSPKRAMVVPLLREDEKDAYVQTYLSGTSGDQGFELLLDELNAYVFGLSMHTSLADRGRLGKRIVAARDGVAHFQLYLLLYLKHLRVTDPTRHAELRKTHGKLVGTVWKSAEQELERSAPWPGLGLDDRWYLYRAWDKALLEELDQFVGGRAWSSTLQKRFSRDPPAGPTPPEKRGGRVTARRSDQRKVRASVHIGDDRYEYEESTVPGSVVLTRNGERLSVRTWAEVEALDLPAPVIKALGESRAPLDP